jgi:hypothetical protein
VSGEPIGGGIERDARQGPGVAVDLPGDPTAAADARRALEPLRQRLGESTFGDVRLLVSELVADEMRGREGGEAGPLRLSASLGDGVLRIELADDWSDNELPAERPEPGEPGWGLYLARILADRWGLEPASTGSRVWLEVGLAA